METDIVRSLEVFPQQVTILSSEVSKLFLCFLDITVFFFLCDLSMLVLPKLLTPMVSYLLYSSKTAQNV